MSEINCLRVLGYCFSVSECPSWLFVICQRRKWIEEKADREAICAYSIPEGLFHYCLWSVLHSHSRKSFLFLCYLHLFKRRLSPRSVSLTTLSFPSRASPLYFSLSLSLEPLSFVLQLTNFPYFHQNGSSVRHSVYSYQHLSWRWRNRTESRC